MALTQVPSGMIAPAQTLSLNGVTFPATQSASADANTLDDYEEGTWTPTLFGTGAAGTFTGTTYGYYTKIGNVVTVVGRIENSTIAGATGDFNFGGLPFVTKNVTRNEGAGAYSSYNVTFDTSKMQSITGQPGTTLIGFLQSSSGSTWIGLPVTNASSIYFNFTFTYFAS
jgi:hypothetical protein